MGYYLLDDENTIYDDVYKEMDIKNPRFAIDFEIISDEIKLKDLEFSFDEFGELPF